MIHFVGTSFAAQHLKAAAQQKGLEVTDDLHNASLVFVSEDTPTNDLGERNLEYIRKLVRDTFRRTEAPVVMTSQVPPGFTRSLNLPIWHQAETLRVKDAMHRALNPEQHIVGCANPIERLPYVYFQYLRAFKCPILKMTYEDAEFAKIAINLTLAAQVENANRLAYAATQCNADWRRIKMVLQNDRRVGAYSYLDPGDWRESRHLLRDWVTYESLVTDAPRYLPLRASQN